MLDLTYTRDFQIKLIANMLADAKWFADVSRSLKLSDFDTAGARLIFEVAFKYFKQHDEVPTKDIVVMEVERALNNPELLLYETDVPVQEYESLAYMIYVLTSLPQDAYVPTYYRAELPRYLAHTRLASAEIQAAAFGGGASARIEDIVKIHNELTILGAGDTITFSDGTDTMSFEKATDAARCGTGLPHIDNMFNGGINTQAGHIALFAACSGVGKTTGVINFAVNASLKMHYSLIITLENPLDMIKGRLQAIYGHIDARWLNTPIREWPVAERKRLDYVNDKNFKYRGYVTVYDGSLRSHSTLDIERVIMRWKDKLVDDFGVDEKRCRNVYIDWLEKINPLETPGVTARMGGDIQLQRVCEHIGEIGRRSGTGSWVTQQCTRDAIGREVITSKHIAHAIHLMDPMDVAMGLAPIIDPTAVAATSYGDGATGERPACDRGMNISFLKARESQVAGLYKSVWQGSTLRFWINKGAAGIGKRIAEEGDMDALHSFMETSPTTTKSSGGLGTFKAQR